MGLKSRMKGKRGEREARDYLKSLGFGDATRTAQHCGKSGTSDVVCVETLPNVMVEVKFGYPRTAFFAGSSVWLAACEQASRDSTVTGKAWVVLWRNKGCQLWNATFFSLQHQCCVNVAGDTAIAKCLNQLEREQTSQ